MSEYPSEMPEEPTGIGSIIRVVFNGPEDCGIYTFYIGAAPGWWIEYNGEIEEDFTWQDMLQIIRHDEAKEFEVVYEGFGDTETVASRHHPKDWIWKAGL